MNKFVIKFLVFLLELREENPLIAPGKIYESKFSSLQIST